MQSCERLEARQPALFHGQAVLDQETCFVEPLSLYLFDLYPTFRPYVGREKGFTVRYSHLRRVRSMTAGLPDLQHLLSVPYWGLHKRLHSCDFGLLAPLHNAVLTNH